jgi:serine/threonine protein kinase
LLGCFPAQGFNRRGGWLQRIVAAKILNGMRTDDSQKHFERELRFLSQLSHPNIVELIGASTVDEIILVTAFCNSGSLSHFLHQEEHDYNTVRGKHRRLPAVPPALFYAFPLASPSLRASISHIWPRATNLDAIGTSLCCRCGCTVLHTK